MPLGITRTSRAPSARTSAASADDAHTTTCARRSSGRKSHGSRFASSTSDPHAWRTSGLPVASPATAEGSQWACTTSASRAARRAARAKREQEERQQQALPRLGPQVVRDPVAVRDPEVPERLRRDDAHVDARLAEVADRVLDEQPGDLTGVTRIRRRQHADPHGASSRRPNTAGATMASIAKTKK